MPILGEVTLYAQWKKIASSTDAGKQESDANKGVSSDEQLEMHQTLLQTGDDQFVGIMVSGLVILVLASLVIATHSARKHRL